MLSRLNDVTQQFDILVECLIRNDVGERREEPILVGASFQDIQRLIVKQRVGTQFVVGIPNGHTVAQSRGAESIITGKIPNTVDEGQLIRGAFYIR